MEFKDWKLEDMGIVSAWERWLGGPEAVFTCDSIGPSQVAEYAGLMVYPPDGATPKTCSCSTRMGVGAVAATVTVPPGSWVRVMLLMNLLGPWIDRVPTASLWDLSYVGGSNRERHPRRRRKHHHAQPTRQSAGQLPGWGDTRDRLISCEVAIAPASGRGTRGDELALCQPVRREKPHGAAHGRGRHPPEHGADGRSPV